MDYTDEQFKAINYLDGDLVVVAGAGAGKTRVLVDRLINILKTKRANIDEIVAITYTEKAALEIKERVRDALDKEINGGNEYLKAARDKLGISLIGTIHGFCLNIIKQNPVEADIDTDLNIMDDTNVDELIDISCTNVIKAKLSDKNVFELVKSLSYDNFYKAIKDMYIKYRNTGMDANDLYNLADTLNKKIVVDVINAIDKEYGNLKKRRNLIDYEDMLIKAYEVISNYEDVLNFYKNKFKYILVDEYQDLNYIQDKLIRMLDTGKNLFVVGDKKQSIYRFRGARVELFDKLYNDLSKKGQSVNLDTNFRSLPDIIEFVNKGFCNILTDYGAMKAFRTDDKEGKQVEYILSTGENMKEKKDMEASNISNKILSLINEGYKFGDIAILVNKRTHVDYYTKELKSKNIPFHVIMNGGLFENRYVMNLLNALTAISTQQMVYIYSVLTNIFGLSDEIFCKLILDNKKITVQDLRNYNNKDVNGFLDIFDEWLYLKDKLSVIDLVKRIINDGHIYSACYKDGEQAISDVLKFEDIVRKYDNMGYTLEMFLNEIQKYKDESEAQISRDDSDVVKFITIHSSKGLQFPVVIFADTSSDFHKFNNNAILFEPDIGIAIKGEEDYDDVKNKMISDETEEYKRLLYVVLTRAKDKLIISANDSSMKNSFSTLINNNFNISSQTDNFDKEDIAELKPLTPKIHKFNKFDKFAISQTHNFSISSLMDFFRCNRKFMIYYQYGINEDEFKENNGKEGLSGIDIGNIVHGIIERNDSKSEAMSTLNLLKKDMNYLDFKYIEDCLNSYYDSDFSMLKDYVSEFSFMLNIDDFKSIKGRIDRYYNDNGNIILADFKTNSHIDNDLFNNYVMQIRIYALALLNMGYNVKKAVLFNLHENKVHEIDITKNALERILNDIKDAVHLITCNNDIRYYKVNEKACKFCGYQNNICRYLGE